MATLLIFLAVLCVLVLSHEFGHFIVARKNGIKVEEFGFGFPPRITGFRRSDTFYSINWIPLGGFVKIKGEDGAEANDADSFSHKKNWQKASVLVAGVVMNVLVAILLISIGLMIGSPQEVSDQEASRMSNVQLEIVQLVGGKPAESAGIQPGDVITKVDALNNPTVSQFQNYVNAHRSDTLAITIQRGQQTLVKNIHPAVYADTGKAGIGVAIAQTAFVRYPWYSALYYGATTSWQYLKDIVVGFYGLIKSLFQGAGVGNAVSGPVGVAVMTGEAARMGFVYLLKFTALLSLNLAVLNILPIPALDGGRLLFVIIAAIQRRPVTPRLEQIVHSVGFALLMLLVVVVTVKDIGTFSQVFREAWGRLF